MATLQLPTPTIIGDSFEKTAKQLGWNVIIFNDDINTFQHVEECLQKYLHYSLEKAQKTSKEINDKGKAVVYQGLREPCEFYYESLTAAGLSATLSK